MSDPDFTATHPDAENAAPAEPAVVRLADYAPPGYAVISVDLDFSLDPARTTVHARLDIQRSPKSPSDAPLILNGEQMELISIAIEGDPLDPARYQVDEKTLTVFSPPEAFILETQVVIAPQANTALSGLYLSNGMFCTQCEAEGFRRITYFPDRPDVLATYAVRIEADRKAYPVLLSNGNKLNAGDLPNGRHFVQWADPHPKPSYLFALVGGDLASVDDKFVTRSGREVALQVFVQPHNADKCAYTLDALKRAMKWDEETFGREYDLDIFMIVAVDHFNFGAMENKGLNIFNAAYVLASPQTATDWDYETIESIVAHEYFHNWSGNRVTCRDWFQLCLKEGFTVFRDQEFSADMRSRPVQRIRDVRRLWASQFPEDDGPLAHPVRPSSYMTIDNFYTATVYEKGAELCRMIKTLIGADAFRKGSDLYFSRHDGHAATVEDFMRAMEDASGATLKQFWRWYEEAGTPTLFVETRRDGDSVTLSLRQHTPPTPGQPTKSPRPIPVAYALVGAENGAVLHEGLIDFKDAELDVRVDGAGGPVVASVLREYSAPVRLEQSLTLDERLTLLRQETDLFNRWATGEKLWRDLCLAFAGAGALEDKETALDKFARALGESLETASGDPAFASELLAAPSDAELAQTVDVIDPDRIVAARDEVRRHVASRLRAQLTALYERLAADAPYDPNAGDAGRRALRNTALGLLVAAGEDDRADAQARAATNMTDEAAAVAALAVSDSPLREGALKRFFDKWREDPLVVNKWLGWRALAPAASALKEVKALRDHEAFDAVNPNKVRALIGVFAMRNLAGFHRADGAGYDFLAEEVVSLDRTNPQLAARLVQSLENWRKLEPVRRAAAQAAIEKIAGAKPISANVFEMASRLVAD